MLHTDYRPNQWADFIGHEKAVNTCRGALELQRRKIVAGKAKDGLAFTITGLSGAGKTTLALLLAQEAGASGMDVMELDGDKCNAGAVRELEQSGGFLSTRPWATAKAIVVNEYHGCTPKAVQAWLTLLERLPKWALVVFTSTEDSADMFGGFSGPFARRCINVQLSNQGLAKPFGKRLETIAADIGVDLTEKQALQIIRDAGNNLGRAIEALEEKQAELIGAALAA